MSAILGTSADWYLMRASGFVALILMTATIGLGVSNLGRLAKGQWTRTVAALVHRNVSLLAVVFLVIHIITAISDKYVKVPALSILIPGLSRYDPLWVGLGALSLDLTLAVVVTSLLRARLRQRTWRLVHWLAYLSWPSAMLHAIGSGSGTGADTGAGWSTLIYLACGAAFGSAVAARLWLSGRPQIAGAPVRPPSRYPALATVPAAPARSAPHYSRRSS
jgi:predicted ferric reductase